MTDDEIERFRRALEAGESCAHPIAGLLLAALDEARAEAERLRGDLRAETWRADHGHREIAARAEEARAYAERMMHERDEAERQRDVERVRAAEWQAVARDSEAARARLVEERDRAREHVSALQRCLGERAPDEPESYAQAVGAAMREGIEAERDRARRDGERQTAIWRERWETLAAALSEQLGPWEGCGVDVALARLRDRARHEAIEAARNAAIDAIIDEVNGEQAERCYRRDERFGLRVATVIVRRACDALLTESDTRT